MYWTGVMYYHNLTFGSTFFLEDRAIKTPVKVVPHAYADSAQWHTRSRGVCTDGQEIIFIPMYLKSLNEIDLRYLKYSPNARQSNCIWIVLGTMKICDTWKTAFCMFFCTRNRDDCSVSLHFAEPMELWTISAMHWALLNNFVMVFSKQSVLVSYMLILFY